MCRLRVDWLVRHVLGLLAVVAGGLVLVIVWYLFQGAKPALESGLPRRFFGDPEWQPGSVRDPQYGLVPMLAGSFLVTVFATALATPLGIAGAVFYQFYVPARVSRWNLRCMELLAGMPAVVLGFWGLMVVVPAISRLEPPGQSLLAAALVLALMILPIIALTSQAALSAVPLSHLQAAAGLGIGRAGMIWNIALPAAKGGIGSGVLLALARAIGETLVVVMLCGNIAQIPGSVFDPIRPVTSTIALEMGYATASHKALLYAGGLILVLVIGLLVGGLSFRRKPNHNTVH
ncbi:MAG: phosphate ABC transporter permease subunit PstC [Verrucomicrobiales bacterium]|nr:phosphate ABC transporter permease subunit PstC [Verrucomicrobiales bacterium]